MGIESLFEGNKRWAAAKISKEPGFFKRHSEGQQPDFLWIGCADSRVDPQDLTGQDIGSEFIHRNVANLVIASDKSMLASIAYAVSVIKVKHIIICGHYNCGGVQGSVDGVPIKAVSDWIEPLSSLYQENQSTLDAIEDKEKKLQALVELNVKKQVENMAGVDSVKARWDEGGELTVHGFVYQLPTGTLVDLKVSQSGPEQNAYAI